METKTCKICQATFQGGYALHKHRKSAHPESFRGRKDNEPKKALTGLAQLNAIQGEVQKAIDLAEFERDELHRKIIEYDDTIARYKKMLERNGK